MKLLIVNFFVLEKVVRVVKVWLLVFFVDVSVQDFDGDKIYFVK